MRRIVQSHGMHVTSRLINDRLDRFEPDARSNPVAARLAPARQAGNRLERALACLYYITNETCIDALPVYHRNLLVCVGSMIHHKERCASAQHNVSG